MATAPRGVPGPRQVFPSNIVRINFPNPTTGMIFIWVSWEAEGPTLPPNGVALISGLPGEFGTIDIFSAPSPVVDPDPASAAINADTNEPITDKALDKFLHWSAHSPINSTQTQNFPPTYVYYATSGPEFDNDTAFLPYPGTDLCGNPLTNAGAYGASFLKCNSQVKFWLDHNGYSDVFDSMGYSGSAADVQRYCDGINAWGAANAYAIVLHVASIDLGGGGSLVKVKNYAVITLNAKKLRKYLPDDPDTHQKPESMTFTVTANDFQNTSSKKGEWKILGYAISSVVPPKGDGIRVFPLDSDNLKPTWSEPGASGGETYLGPVGGARVDFIVDFVPRLIVAMERFGGNTPPPSG